MVGLIGGLIDWLIDIRSFGECFVGLERRASDVC